MGIEATRERKEGIYPGNACVAVPVWAFRNSEYHFADDAATSSLFGYRTGYRFELYFSIEPVNFSRLIPSAFRINAARNPTLSTILASLTSRPIND
jgi:hypothetical protein